MSSNTANNLSRERLQQLIAAIGSENNSSDEQIQAEEHNWKQPHCFSSKQLEKLQLLVTKTAEKIAEKFTDIFRHDFNVTAVSATQHFSDELLKDVSDENQNNFYTYISAKNEQTSENNMLVIPAETAIKWTTQLLGDSGPEKDSEKELSDLEESLLLDIIQATVDSLSESCENRNFNFEQNIQSELEIESQDDSKELCKILFTAKKEDADDGCDFYFIIECDKLAAEISKQQKTQKKLSGEEIQTAMLKNIKNAPVSVNVRFAKETFTLDQLLSLQNGDLLLLEKNIGKPVDVIMANKTIFRGQPAKSNGKYAVVITEAKQITKKA